MCALSAYMKFEKVPSKHARHKCQELIRTLNVRVSICISFLRLCSAYKRKNSQFEKGPSKHAEHAQGTDAWTKRMRQELMLALRVRSQELMRMLSMHIRN
jgi:hypothetical protein